MIHLCRPQAASSPRFPANPFFRPDVKESERQRAGKAVGNDLGRVFGQGHVPSRTGQAARLPAGRRCDSPHFPNGTVTTRSRGIRLPGQRHPGPAPLGPPERARGLSSAGPGPEGRRQTRHLRTQGGLSRTREARV